MLSVSQINARFQVTAAADGITDVIANGSLSIEGRLHRLATVLRFEKREQLGFGRLLQGHDFEVDVGICRPCCLDQACGCCDLSPTQWRERVRFGLLWLRGGGAR